MVLQILRVLQKEQQMVMAKEMLQLKSCCIRSAEAGS